MCVVSMSECREAELDPGIFDRGVLSLIHFFFLTLKPE